MQINLIGIFGSWDKHVIKGFWKRLYLMAQYHEVLTRPELLCEDYFPSDILGREKQLNAISYCLEPANKKMKPVHAWIYGQSGTGKTVVAKYILKKSQKETNADGVYINCWENNSFFSILDKLVRELRILGAEKLNVGFKLERLQQFIGKKGFIIILDEFDQVKAPDSDDTIYNLCTYENIGLICISKSRLALYSLDERILSRLNPQQISFPSYTEEDIFQILMKRALFSLRPGSYKESTLHYIARLADGDSRVAIQTLRNAAYMAEKENSPTIKQAHIKSGHHSWKDLEKSYLLNKLNSHHRMLYGLVKEKKTINSGELWKAYLAKCQKQKRHPIAVRTFSEYMNKLIELDLVHWDRALVRGKVRVFSVGE